MGFRSRIKNKIKGTLGGVGALAKVIHDEANHPGRPQPHMAARNPLWGGGEVERPETDPDLESPSESDGAASVDQTKASPEGKAEPDYWFLNDPEGEADDWSKTNPKG